MKINHYRNKKQAGGGKAFRCRATALCAAALLALSPLSTAAEAADTLPDTVADYDLCVFGGGGGGGGGQYRPSDRRRRCDDGAKWNCVYGSHHWGDDLFY